MEDLSELHSLARPPFDHHQAQTEYNLQPRWNENEDGLQGRQRLTTQIRSGGQTDVVDAH